MRFEIVLSSAMLLAPIVAAGAQTSRWNDRTSDNWKDEAPIVSVWFDDSRQLHFGSSPRVRFRVEEDAYVVVGRVDSDGRMTILFPYSRTSRSFVQGGVDNIVRSRRGGSTFSFTAYERWGIGFVFAISSYEPLDLSRIQNRDFENDGGVANAISHRYMGNPQRIVETFAPWVLWDRDTPYEYDIATYSVEGPTYASASSFCGDSYFGYGGSYGALYDRSFCHSAYGYYGLFCSSFLGYGSALCYDPYFGRFGYRGGIIAAGPQNPPSTPSTPEGGPNTKLIPQIPSPGDDGKITGGQKALVLPTTRPEVGGTAGDDELNRVYSIPRRALNDLRRQERVEGRPIGEIAGGTRISGGSDAHPAPGGRSNDGEGRPTRGDRRERGDDRPLGNSGRQDWARDRDNPTTRGDSPRNDPPPRESPRNFDPPSRDEGGGRLGGSNGGSYQPPPRSFDPPSHSGGSRGDPGGRSSSGGGGSPGGGARTEGGSRSSQPSPPPPRTQSPAVREPATEKKPEKP